MSSDVRVFPINILKGSAGGRRRVVGDKEKEEEQQEEGMEEGDEHASLFFRCLTYIALYR